jgi:hypothetical protein
MAQCEGTTRSGDRCKLDAQPGSPFCHLHQEQEGEAPSGNEPGESTLEWEDVAPLLLAGVLAAGMILFLRSFGRWIPRL